MRHLCARSTLYCGFSVLGGPAGRTLTSDGGGVLLSISSDAKALTIRWRAYEVISAQSWQHCLLFRPGRSNALLAGWSVSCCGRLSIAKEAGPAHVTAAQHETGDCRLLLAILD